MSTSARYLFAVTRRVDPVALQTGVGFHGAPLELIEHRGLQAVVCDVDVNEFGEAPMRESLEDLGWVERVARTHDEVVRVVASAGTVAPLRMVTICTDDDSVRSRLEEWGDQISTALDRVEGCHEWSVKAFETAPEEVAVQRSAGASGEPAPGTGATYLQQKLTQARRRQDAEVAAAERADAVHVALRGAALASRLLGAQDPTLTGRPERMILNGAYLVREDESQRFLACVEDLRERYPGVSIEAAGPWPAYSFTTLDADGHGR